MAYNSWHSACIVTARLIARPLTGVEMMRKVTLGAVALAVSTMIGSAASYADLFGEIWLNEPACC